VSYFEDTGSNSNSAFHGGFMQHFHIHADDDDDDLDSCYGGGLSAGFPGRGGSSLRGGTTASSGETSTVTEVLIPLQVRIFPQVHFTFKMNMRRDLQQDVCRKLSPGHEGPKFTN
jgi:hypothetical protein